MVKCAPGGGGGGGTAPVENLCSVLPPEMREHPFCLQLSLVLPLFLVNLSLASESPLHHHSDTLPLWPPTPELSQRWVRLRFGSYYMAIKSNGY